MNSLEEIIKTSEHMFPIITKSNVINSQPCRLIYQLIDIHMIDAIFITCIV